MNPNLLSLNNIGPLREANLGLGDLTVFVGPQATGKSIALQFLKMILDLGPIRTRLGEHGVDWEGNRDNFLDAFLGEGMRGIWGGASRLECDGQHFDLDSEINKRGRRKKESSLFFIPAQRVLTLRGGWPRPFSDYASGDPFTVRDFSDSLRMLMEGDLGKEQTALFPKSNRLTQELRDVLDDAVFHRFGLRVDKVQSQKRLVLRTESGASLPFMVWSAGQREFVPLLLGLYWLLPGARTGRRGGVEWVVIEELEMGLHPKAVNAAMLLVLELLWRGYRVCLSTHSPQVLDVLWALRVFRERQGEAKEVLELFGLKDQFPNMLALGRTALAKTVRVHYFDLEGQTREISNLDPGSEQVEEAGWGGLSEFSGRIGDLVSRVVSRAELEAVK